MEEIAGESYDMISVNTIATIAEVDPGTVRDWIESGKGFPSPLARLPQDDLYDRREIQC